MESREKLPETKKLSLYALVCIGFTCVINSIIALISNAAGDLPLKIRMFLLVWGILQQLPLLGVSLWSFCQKTITKNSATGILILTGVFFVLGAVLGTVQSMVIPRIFSVEILGQISVINVVQRLFSPVTSIARILVCCSAAIELYVLKKEDSK